MRDALDTFEEFDPDEDRGGTAARVAGVLIHFGPAAAPLAGALAAKYDPTTDDCGMTLVQALRAMGPAAAPYLEKIENG